MDKEDETAGVEFNLSVIRLRRWLEYPTKVLHFFLQVFLAPLVSLLVFVQRSCEVSFRYVRGILVEDKEVEREVELMEADRDDNILFLDGRIHALRGSERVLGFIGLFRLTNTHEKR